MRPYVGVALAYLAGTAAWGAVDPFYSSRLQDGITSFERGSYDDAVRSLRIACFGMLDDEHQLADCLVRLALAQASAGDRDAFSQTFHRIAEGEELVGLYSKSALPAELTRPFEAKVLEIIPKSVLAAAGPFQRLVADQREAQLAALAPKAQRDRLVKLEKEEPKVARWPLLLARLEKQQRDPKAALSAAEHALALDKSLVEARCLRGWARSASGKHADAMADLAGCESGDPDFATAELASLVELQRWTDAQALLGRIPAERRQNAEIAALARRIEAAAPPRAAASTSGSVAASTPRPTPVPARVPPVVTPQATPARNGDGLGGASSAKPWPTPVPPTATRAQPTPAMAAPAPVLRPTPVPPSTRPAPTPASSSPGSTALQGPTGGALPAADETLLARAQGQLAAARTTADIEGAYSLARDLAMRYPSHPRVQFTAAEIAYRASRWSDAVRHFRQGGGPSEAQPLLMFYLAVALWESGDHAQAATVMRRCEGKLRPTSFVQGYRDKILGPGH